MEVKNEVLGWRENESQEEQRGLFTSSTPAWHVAKPVVGDVLQYESSRIMSIRGNVGETIW